MPSNDLVFLNSLFSQYSDEELASYRQNEVAFANEAYIVTANDGQKYVIRILKTQSPENARIEAEIQQRLEKAQIGTPHYLKLKNGDVVGIVGSDNFTISDFIEGERPKTVSDNLIKDFGSTLAKIHNALEGLNVPASNLQWLNPTHAKKDLDAYSGSLKPKFSKLFQNSEQLFGLDLPNAVIHSDFMVDNVFAKDDNITAVFDFETAEHTFRILDLARTYLSLRNETSHSSDVIRSKLIEGYNATAEQSLTEIELDNLDLAIKFAAVACGAWCATHGATGSAMKYADLVGIE